ncbi:methylmalonyl-CoA mutase subunit beta [Flavobacterium rhizosphaerae]|uniref:Methylmalonyl-CoA mutase subunit beta n=1 Tax=Flavobacterium rhizosphaerae TaxID=3163298 RepID=A0ABW8Z0C8_9FLAO
MQKKLFSDFGPVPSKLWKQRIQYELKGADYNDTLVWESPEGIKVKPFYHRDEAAGTYGVTTIQEFKIGQPVFVQNTESALKRALKTVKKGAEALVFIIPDNNTDIKSLCEGLPESLPAFFYLPSLSIDLAKNIDAFAKRNKADYLIMADPVGHLAKEGNWYTGQDNFEVLNTLAISCKSPVISVNSSLYQNSGANMVQQIAYTLAHANEYFNRIATIQNPVVIEAAVGSNYFFEIAKLRAIRLLFGTIAAEYGHNPNCHLIVSPTKRNKTLYDYNVNMLRTTTECMSAILGGADTVVNLPYDTLYHKGNEFADRMARNQLLILKEESYFDKVANAADGTYYIEELTQQLAEKALELFKQIEAGGGFIEQLKAGNIQRKIQESATKEQELFDGGKEILVGTNKYINKSDTMGHDLELYPFMKVKPRKTLVTPIIEKRLAENLEQQRLEEEKESESH